MRWKKGPRSDNIEDRRGAGGGGGSPGGFRVPIGGKRGGMGIGTILVVLVLVWLFGGNLGSLFGPGGQVTQAPAPQTQKQPTQRQSTGKPVTNDEMKEFISSVLASTEEVWNKTFTQMGRKYREPKLVLFSNYVRSACGMAQSAMGPFYCPRDQKV